MTQFSLWDDVRFSMWASASSNLSAVWRKAGAAGGISNYNHAASLWSAIPGRFKNQIRSNAPFSVAGFTSGSGLSGAKAISANDIAFGVVTSRLGIGGMNDALKLTSGKGVAMIVLWIRVEDDSSTYSRWEGGVYETNWGSPWHHHALQPTYAPLVISKQTPAGRPLHGGHRI